MNRTRIASLVLPVLALFAFAATLLPGAAAADAPQWPGIEGSPTFLGKQASSIAGLAARPDGEVWFAGSFTGTPPSGQGIATAQGLVGYFGSNVPLAELVATPGPSLDPRFGPTPDTSLAEPFGAVAVDSEGNFWATSPSSGGTAVRFSGGSGEARSVYAPLSTSERSLSRTTGIAAGPDAAMWVTAEGSGSIGRIPLAQGAAVTSFPLLAGAAALPHAITLGPDGAMWFTEPGIGAIGRITTAGAVTSYPLPNSTAEPNQITTGPDGNLWFTEVAGGKIGRITPQGQVTEFAAEPAGPIVSGPDGDLWFGSARGVGSITTGGTRGAVTCPAQAKPTCSYTVTALAVGADGRLYLGGHASPGEGGSTALANLMEPAFFGAFRVPPASVGATPVTRGQGRNRVRLRLNCEGGFAGQPCKGVLRLQRSGRQIGSRSFTLASGEIRWTSVKINAIGLKALRRGSSKAAVAVTLAGGVRVPKAKVILRSPPGLVRSR
jgi:hypothetical protein